VLVQFNYPKRLSRIFGKFLKLFDGQHLQEDCVTSALSYCQAIGWVNVLKNEIDEARYTPSFPMPAENRRTQSKPKNVDVFSQNTNSPRTSQMASCFNALSITYRFSFVRIYLYNNYTNVCCIYFLIKKYLLCFDKGSLEVKYLT
jgi:hypothetical protein